MVIYKMKKRRKIVKKMIKISIFLLFLFILGNVAMYFYCLITPKTDINKAQSYYLYDSTEKLIFDDNEDWIDLDKISQYVVDATIYTEDRYFYKHIGFDYLRIMKVMFTNIINGSKSAGASTITQQYARNLFLRFEKTWKRKIEEAILAFELEVHYTKEEILEGYLNTINYGGVFGIENAAWYYFGKSSSDLTLAEATILAGIPQSPSNYSPFVNEEKAKKRQKVMLISMVNNGVITKEEMDEALETKLVYAATSDKEILGSLMYFRDAVIKELEDINSIPNSLIETGGLRIYTTLDIAAQTSLEDSIDKYMNTGTELQVAGILMDPNTGSVLGLIGGVNYTKSQFNRAISSKRQVGSTMKPFLYYSALESGFTPSSTFTSEKTTFYFSNDQTYSPKNYNDLYANAPICMGSAISYSDNIYAVKTHLFLGEEMLVNISNRVGITSELQAVPSLALGTGEITLIEMVTGYSAFANLGYRVKAHFITKIEDSKGNILYQYKEVKDNILNPSITFILNEMLTYTYDMAFIDYNYPTIISLINRMTHKYSIKSGTTDTDMWIIGYNSDVVLGIWNGYDNNIALTTDDFGYNKNIWVDTIEGYLKDKDSPWYAIPDNVVGVIVNPLTGKLASTTDTKTKVFYYIKGTEPSSNPDLDSVFSEKIH